MRNTKRHKYVVARRPDFDDDTIVEWFWEVGFVQPTSATDLISRNSDGFTTLTEEVEIKTRSDKPTIVDLHRDGFTRLRPDYTYWQGRYWETKAQAQWLGMGRSGYNTYVGQFNVAFADLSTPPAFAEEYDAFVESVAGVERTIELPLQSLINKIGA